MSSETNATNAFIALLTGGGVVAAINENATLISIGIAFLGLLMGLFFHILTFRHRARAEKRETKEYRQKIKEEILSEINKDNQVNQK